MPPTPTAAPPEDPDLIAQMKATSAGAYCEACMRAGQVYTTNRQGTPITEQNRCPGCGRIVCDRHTMLEGADPQVRHFLDLHQAAPRET